MVSIPEEKILIIEDENITALEIQNKLEKWGYDVVGTAGSGEEAIQIANENEIELILADIVLRGDMDGIDAVDRISDRYDVPVIYLTAHADNDTFSRAKMTKPSGYVIKPFDDTELRYSIEIALLRTDYADRALQAKDKERMATVRDFMLSSTPALTSQVRIQDTAKFLKEFANLFETNMHHKMSRELKLDDDSVKNNDNSRKILTEYIAWVTNMFTNIGYRIETGSDDFTITECLWSPNVNDNKIYCLMCRAMVELSLNWTEIDVKMFHSYLLGPNPPKCRFSFHRTY
ncbi:MAG: methanogen output domain 1-containing protein [Methanobacterium sp. ERen5]|nr:MAG: methanogen output domain 1-containing protein [Methanobacterium sp. ERen5]